MLRKIFFVLTVLCMCANFGAFALDESKNDEIANVLKSVAPYLNENRNASISRGDCITAIMKVIGVDSNTADMYTNAAYDQPVFRDLEHNNTKGYIVLAKYSEVAVGVKIGPNGIGYFEPNRYVTIKECLTFMLRCLKDPTTVEWENIISQAEEIGLLESAEVQNLNTDEALTGDMFKTLLERMLNKNRYLYWPEEEPTNGYAKRAKVDLTNSIKYIDSVK